MQNAKLQRHCYMECMKHENGITNTRKNEMNWWHTDILGISKLRYTRIGQAEDHTVYYSGYEKQRTNGITFIIRKCIVKQYLTAMQLLTE